MTTDDNQHCSMTKPLSLSPAGRALFVSKVAAIPDATSCWLWRGRVDARGYGIFSVSGKDVKATHVALQMSGKLRPSDASALHRCDNPPCVRPSHLRWGTQTENVKDMDERSRRVPPKGSRHGHAKLTEDDVRAIRSSSVRSGLLAEQFGVKAGTIRDIRSGRRGAWRHV